MEDAANQDHPSGVRLTPRITLHESAVDFSYASSSGPGGQNVNKRATKCTLRVRVDAIPFGPAQRARLESLGSVYLTGSGELVIDCDEHRSQARNREGCIEKLSDLVRRASVLPKTRRKTKPTRGSIERRLKEKKVRSERKQSRRHED